MSNLYLRSNYHPKPEERSSLFADNKQLADQICARGSIVIVESPELVKSTR